MIPPAPIPPEALRPRRRWYWVGGALVAIGCLAGLAGFVFGLVKAIGLPDFAVTFASGAEPSSFRAQEVNGEGKKWLLYADTVVASADDCTIEGTDPSAAVDPPSYTHNSWSGGQEWHLVGELYIGETGEYSIACHSSRKIDYAVGYGDSGFRVLRNLAVTLAITFLLPTLGVAAGSAVLIVTGVRRGRHKARLMREAMRAQGYAGP